MDLEPIDLRYSFEDIVQLAAKQIEVDLAARGMKPRNITIFFDDAEDAPLVSEEKEN